MPLNLPEITPGKDVWGQQLNDSLTYLDEKPGIKGDKGDTGTAGAAGGTDAATAEWVEDGPLTSAALSAKYVQEGSAFADIGKQPGVDPTGATECSSAIQSALDSFSALGVRAYARGTFKTTATVTIRDNCDMSDATISYSGTGTALVIGDIAAPLFLEYVAAPRVINTAKTQIGWAQVAGSVGIKLVNLYSCPHIEIPRAQDFETGLLMYGQGRGIVYNTLQIGHLANNKVNQRLDADSSGWSNQNTFIGGRYGHNNLEALSSAGARHILMTGGLNNDINNNTWLSPSLEAGIPEFHVEFAGQSNVIYNGRFECPGGARVKWQNGTTRCAIEHGYDTHLITETFGTGISGCVINSGTRERNSRSNAGPIHVLENQSSNSNTADAVLPAGATSLGLDPDVAYTVRRSSIQTDMKATGDAHPRLRFLHAQGRIYFGSGTAAPTAFMSPSGTTGMALFGNWLPASNGTYELGSSANRWKNVWLSGDAVVGGALKHEGATAGFYGKTPVTQPAANPDTSGATLADLEAEVNQLKALLRSVGLMA